MDKLVEVTKRYSNNNLHIHKTGGSLLLLLSNKSSILSTSKYNINGKECAELLQKTLAMFLVPPKLRSMNSINYVLSKLQEASNGVKIPGR